MYTKGEWKVNTFPSSNQLCIETSTKRIAKINKYYENAEANAQLIASAPYLLGVLKLVRDYRSIHHKLPPKDTLLMEKIEQAINKAEKGV